ncbi:hypothetical protein GCM10027403_15810 [Arthrobacter tecti]
MEDAGVTWASVFGCDFFEAGPDLSHIGNELVTHRDEGCDFEMLQLSLACSRDVRPTGCPFAIGYAVPKVKILETWIVRIDPHPGVAVEGLARVYVATREFRVQQL